MLPQGYVAEKVSILLGALRSALKRVGLVVHTVDDSLPASEQHSRNAAADVPSTTGSPSPRTQSGSLDHIGNIKIPGIHSFSEPIERVLHDAAEYHDSKAMHVAHEAMQGDRVHKNHIAM